MDKDIPYLSTKSLFGGVSKELCQLFKYALYKCLHLSFTVTCLKMDHNLKCKHYTLHRLGVLSFYIMKPTFLIYSRWYVQKRRLHLICDVFEKFYPTVHSIAEGKQVAVKEKCMSLWKCLYVILYLQFSGIFLYFLLKMKNTLCYRDTVKANLNLSHTWFY